MKKIIAALLSLNILSATLTASDMSASSQESLFAKKYELTLYYTPWCPYSQKVLTYLQKIHKTLPMKDIQTDLAAKEFLKKEGGKSQVPCLFINGRALYESDTIIDWLSKHKEAL